MKLAPVSGFFVVAGAILFGSMIPYMVFAHTFAADGVAVVAACVTVIAGIGLYKAFSERTYGSDADHAMIVQWKDYATELERKLDAARDALKAARRPEIMGTLPEDVEAIRTGIHERAEELGHTVSSLLNNLIAFKEVVPQLAARLATAEAERDAAREELAIVDDMQSRRRVAKNGTPKVAAFDLDAEMRKFAEDRVPAGPAPGDLDDQMRIRGVTEPA